MIHKVEGIIIRSVDYGEGNKILTLYTKELGKIGVMAKGAKKTKSRLSAVSQIFSYGYFVFYHGGGLGSLTSGDIIYSFRSIHQDIFKTGWSAYLVELLDKLTEEKNTRPYLFYLLHTALRLIDEGRDPEMVVRIFELQLLQEVGVMPEFNHCVNCKNSSNPFLAFSVKEGGLICEICLSKDPHAIVLSSVTIRLLRTLVAMNIEKLGKVNIKDVTRKQLALVMRSFFDTYVGISIKSRNFLDQLYLFDQIRMKEVEDNESSNN